MANIRIVNEEGEILPYQNLCMSRNALLRPYRGEYIRTRDGKILYEVLSSEWCEIPDNSDCLLLMTLRKVQNIEKIPAANAAKPTFTKESSSPLSDVPHFYLRYRCKVCGTKYGNYPEQCHSCGIVGSIEEIEPEYQSLMI